MHLSIFEKQWPVNLEGCVLNPCNLIDKLILQIRMLYSMSVDTRFRFCGWQILCNEVQ